ncbi:MAG: DUF1566 domain-containing protein [Bacteroidetes bacterium]|nr:DUF1566 domain-containing protein [Bacteroidota bacterium]
MKKIVLLSIIVIMGITLIGCEFTENPSNRNTTTTGSISVGGTSETRASLADEHTSIDKLWIRAFKTTGELIPAAGVSDTDGAAVLTWNETVQRFTGSMTLDLTGYTDQLYFHAMAFTAAGEIVYQGTVLTSQFGLEPIDITTGSGYSIGDRGPGGGWIFYDKGAFNNDSKMGKSWRYLEAAAEDFSLAWDSTDDLAKIDTTTHKIAGGKVTLLNDTIELTEYDWYWGAAGAQSTRADIKEGWLNTDILDGLTSATPAIGRKAKGRKTSGDAGNTRRDTSTELRNDTINNYTDWFVPSKNELYSMLTNIVNGGTRSDWNFSETKYWSSTEYAGGDVSGDYPDDIYWAWAIDFTDGEEAEVLLERSEAYPVRPARAF